MIEGRRNDSCRTETPAMHCGKLVPLRHRQKVKYEELIYWHIRLQLDTCYYRQHLYGQTCKNNIISYQWLNVEQKNACLL